MDSIALIETGAVERETSTEVPRGKAPGLLPAVGFRDMDTDGMHLVRAKSSGFNSPSPRNEPCGTIRISGRLQ